MTQYDKRIVIRYSGKITSGTGAGKTMDGYEIARDLSSGSDWTEDSAIARAKQDATRFVGRIDVQSKQYSEREGNFVYESLHVIHCV